MIELYIVSQSVITKFNSTTSRCSIKGEANDALREVNQIENRLVIITFQ